MRLADTREGPPSGIITFLFTDIEGSTRLLDYLGDSYADVIETHRQLLRSCFEEYEGYEISTEGDSFFVAFSRAEDAVKAAVEGQRAIGLHAWPPRAQVRVRMGLHTGEARSYSGSYFGMTIHQAARILSAAHGGQILVSDSTKRAAEAIAVEVSFRDLGLHRLKDLAQPQRIFQVDHPDLESDFPPIRSLDVQPHNLPLQSTSFIGRESQMNDVRRLLQDARLVTLTGPGGSGKTRLALQVGAQLLGDYPDGVWFVDLAPLSEPTLVPHEVASVTGAREQPGRTVTEAVVENLRPKTTLLLLDNCEHLVTACAELADALLRSCERLRVLATSREAFGIGAEMLFRVPPLSLGETGDRDAALPEAVLLFADRARAVQTQFHLNPEHIPAINEICRRLDGIPLAIELAAARVRVLSPQSILERLEDRLRVLAAPRRTAVARHQTLRAMVEWSHDLLSDDEKTMFRRLGVFVSGFSLEAAEGIAADDQIHRDDVLDLLSSLVEKSLVVTEEQPEGVRYRLLDTIRAYALEELTASGEEELLRERHLNWFLEFAEQSESADDVRRAESLSPEHDNMRTALQWSLSHSGAASRGFRLAVALRKFWNLRGHWAEARTWLAQLLSSEEEVEPDLRARVLEAAADFADAQSDYPASRSYAEQSLAVAEQLGNAQLIAAALGSLGHHAMRVGERPAARQFLLRRVETLHRLGDERSEAQALASLGALEVADNLPEGRRLLRESLAKLRRLGDKMGVANLLLQLGATSFALGDYVAASEESGEALVIAREIGYKRFIARALTNLAELALARGDISTARSLVDEALTMWVDVGHMSGLADAAALSGMVAIAERDHEAAERLIQESLELAQRLGAAPRTAAALYARGELERARRNFEAAEARYLEALAVSAKIGTLSGGGRRATQIWGTTESLLGVALVAAARGDYVRAARLLAAAEASRPKGASLPPSSRSEYEAAIARTRDVLGEDKFAQEWAEGEAQSISDFLSVAQQSDSPFGGRQKSL